MNINRVERLAVMKMMDGMVFAGTKKLSFDGVNCG